MAQSKVELLLDIKNRMTTGLTKARDNVTKSTKEMKEKIHSMSAAASTSFVRMRDSLAHNVADMKVQLHSLKDRFSESINGIMSEVPGLGRVFDLIRNPIVAATAAVIALGSAGVASAKDALGWEEGLAKVNVTAQLSKDKLSELSDNLLDIGRRNVAPLQEVPDAFNKIISAGLNAEQSLKALEPTLRASKAGFVDVATVARAGVNVMNSAGRDINTVYDVLFATLNKGAAEMGDIASYLPKVVPVAKNAGFALEETAGAFAFLTAQGQKAEAATTLLEGAFRALADPAKVSKFKELGINLYDSKGKMLPLVNIIEQLSNRLNGLNDSAKAQALASLGLDQMASSAFAVMTQDTEKLKGIIDATTNSQGALNRAYQDSLTSTDGWKIALNNVHYIMIRIGQAFLPVIKKVGEWAAAFTSWLIPAISKVKGFISEWYPVIIGIAGAWAVVHGQLIATTVATAALAVKNAVLTAAQWALNIAMNANPIGLIITAIGALIGAIVVVCRRYEGWTTVWNATKVTLVNSFKQFVENWKFGFTELWCDIQIFWLRIKSFGQYVGQLFSNIGKAIKAALQGNFSEAKDILNQDIKTSASVEIDEIKQKREANRQAFATESIQRAKETSDAWKSASLIRKQEEAEENKPASEDVISEADGGSVQQPLAPDASTQDVTGSVVGSAQQIRNITINIDALNKGNIVPEGDEVKNMGGDQLSDYFSQILMRAIRNVELSY
ncbi:MAG: phage tail tape measure protein [Bacteroidales bacterium]|nr:phage tail tape measure protein [Bacteroidales bacterium]MBR6438032.1 phage tail tape measure protein [Bacteroidales bacterium]